MEPLPEVRAGAERLAALTGIDVLDSIDAVASVAVSIVPSCVGEPDRGRGRPALHGQEAFVPLALRQPAGRRVKSDC